MMNGFCQMFTVMVVHVKSRFFTGDAVSPQQSARRRQPHGGDMTMMYGAEQYMDSFDCFGSLQ